MADTVRTMIDGLAGAFADGSRVVVHIPGEHFIVRSMTVTDYDVLACVIADTGEPLFIRGEAVLAMRELAD